MSFVDACRLSLGGGISIGSEVGDVKFTSSSISSNTSSNSHGGGIYPQDGATPPTLDDSSSALDNKPHGCFGFWSEACRKALMSSA